MGRIRYRLTPRRRASILKAQRISARKRSGKDSFGYWTARGIKKLASKATLGASGMITQFAEDNKRRNRAIRNKKRRKRRR